MLLFIFVSINIWFPAIDLASKDSADEASDLEEVMAADISPTKQLQLEERRETSANSVQPIYTPQSLDTKDIARLRQDVTELERKLKSRWFYMSRQIDITYYVQALYSMDFVADQC